METNVEDIRQNIVPASVKSNYFEKVCLKGKHVLREPFYLLYYTQTLHTAKTLMSFCNILLHFCILRTRLR